MAEWYYGSNAGQHGPVEDDEIRAMMASGGISPQTLVWREGMVDWRPLSSLPEFNANPSPYSGVQNAGPYPPVPGYAPGGVVNSGLAIASMVCGILSVVTFCLYGGIIGIPAVICGHMALNQIRNSPHPMAGRGMAIAGLVTGYLGILAIISMIAFFVIMMMNAPHHSP